MSQLTFQLDENTERAIEELKVFFGTRSSAAAIRSALAVAQTAVPVSKNRTIVVRDQNTNQDLNIVVTG